MHRTVSERALSDSPQALDETEAKHHYTRRTAYARKALAELGKAAGVDLAPIARMYERELRSDEQGLGNQLQPGDEGQATVRVAVRDDADSLEQAAGPAKKGKGAAAPRDVRKISRRTLAGLKRKMAKGQYAEVYSKLHELGFLPDEVDVNGKGLTNKTLVQRAVIPEKVTDRDHRALPGVLVDTEGNSVPTRLDTQVLTTSGMKELGYLDSNGDLDLGATSLPRALAEATLLGISQAMDPQRGIAYQFGPGMKEPAASLVVWQHPTDPTVQVTWGDVRSHMADVWGHEDKKALQLVQQMDDLRGRLTEVEQTLSDKRFPQDPTNTERKRLVDEQKALEDRLDELERVHSQEDRDAQVAGLHWEEDLDEWGRRDAKDSEDAFRGRDPRDPHFGRKAVGPDDGPTSSTVVKREYATDNPYHTPLDHANQLNTYGERDYADSHAFETRLQLPEDPVLTRSREFKRRNPQVRFQKQKDTPKGAQTLAAINTLNEQMAMARNELARAQDLVDGAHERQENALKAQVLQAQQALDTAKTGVAKATTGPEAATKRAEVEEAKTELAEAKRRLEQFNDPKAVSNRVSQRASAPARIEAAQQKIATLRKEMAQQEAAYVAERAKQVHVTDPVEGLRHERGRRTRKAEAKKKAEAEKQAQQEAAKEPLAEVTEPVAAAEALAQDRAEEQAMVMEAPAAVQEAVAALADPEVEAKMTPDRRQEEVDILQRRSRQVVGSFRHHGVAKVLNKVGNLLVNTVHDRIAAISPYLAQLTKAFEVDYRVRSQRLATFFSGFEHAKRLQAGYDDWLAGKATLQQRLLKEAVGKVVAEVRKIDPTFKLDRPPVVFDMAVVQERMAAMREILVRNGMVGIEPFLQSLQANKGSGDFGPTRGGEAPGQVMGAHQRLADLEKALPELQREGFLKTDAPEILAGFTDAAAKYMEFGRHFGASVRTADGGLAFDA